MDSLTKDFYTDCYIKTGGFIPTKPLNTELFPGDFFQIHNGMVWVLGNIFKNNIVDWDEVEIHDRESLNEANWNFNRGMRKPYAGRAKSEVSALEPEFTYSRQIFAFDAPGSYAFTATKPEAIRIANWSLFADALIIELTQNYYSFREVYVVTECASASHWTLAVSGSDKGELELAMQEEHFGLLDLFGQENSKTIQSRDIEVYKHFDNRIPSFFKAKRLQVREDKLETYMSDLIQERSNHLRWGCDYFNGGFEYKNYHAANLSQGYNKANLIDLLTANQLNPNTALDYFKWADTSLDDVVKFFDCNE